MEAAAVKAAKACGYVSAGTVEFLVGADRAFHFLEMNTRIQVEHPLTELRYGVDLVKEQIRIAEGHRLSFAGNKPPSRGHAIEARICAEDADRGFLPSTGRLGTVQLPGGPGVRCDGHVYAGQQITLHYDNLLLKIIAHAEDRPAAIRRLERALYETRLPGLTTNLPFVLRVLRDERFLSGDYDTSIGEDLPAPPLDGKEVVPVVAAALALHRRVPETVVPRARPTRDLPAWVRGDREWTLGR
jgi:acetyl-CoA carboxylase biotin carboxylase subunit